jgi:hypothetical protein
LPTAGEVAGIEPPPVVDVADGVDQLEQLAPTLTGLTS